MRKLLMSIVILMAATFCTSIHAQDAAVEIKPATIAVTGKVVVVENEEGIVTAVKLVVAGDPAVTYNVKLDEKGKALALAEGRDAKVTGIVSVVEEAKWLTVVASVIVPVKAEVLPEPVAE